MLTSNPEIDTHSKFDRSTVVLTDSNPEVRRALSQRPARGTATLHDEYELILLIRGMTERVVMKPGNTYYLGRVPAETDGNIHYIDLTPYGAAERGVSRIHISLYIDGTHIYLLDEGSTNGSFLCGKLIPAHTPTMLHKGDEIMLGRLNVQLMFR